MRSNTPNEGRLRGLFRVVSMSQPERAEIRLEGRIGWQLVVRVRLRANGRRNYLDSEVGLQSLANLEVQIILQGL